MTANGQPPAIFLSYSRTNLAAAVALRTELEKAGFTVFRDEDSIRAGDNWMERLQTALQGCSAFVLLYGRNGVQRWVGAEVQYALGRNLSPHDDAQRLPIFPILLPEGDLHSLPPFLGMFQIQRWQAGQALPATFIQAIRDKSELLDDRNTFEGCPFLGLSAFQPEHANLFFGRREETLDALKLLGTLRDDVRPDRIRVDGQYCRWLQIEGNSGSGKSSLVNAGMLPLIQQGILWARTGYGEWHILKPMMPGEKPLQQLAEVLEHSLLAEQRQRDTGKRYQTLLADDKALALRLRDFKQDGKAFLLVVDQFEELFTFSDPTEKLAFDRQLYTALQDKDCPLFVISTVRIDFLEHFEQLPCLKELYRQRLCERYLLPTVTQRGLQEAIEQPARLAGLDVGAVTTAMLNDAKGEPGALPLVENALRVLWEQREGNRLSGELYIAKGGIAGLLEEQADALLKRLDSDLPKGKADALELLLALTRINDEGRHTRRRLPLGEARLAAGGKKVDPKRGQQVIDYLTGRPTPDGGNRKANGSLRLLVTVGDNAHDQSIDLIHETLIRAKGKDEATGKLVGYWKTLYDYIDKNRERGFYRDQLARQAKEWQGKSAWGRWFNLAGWGELHAYRKLRPERGSPDDRFLRRSRVRRWTQILLLVGVLGVFVQSAWWASQNNLPFGYALLKPLWAAGLYSPIPEMVDIIKPGQEVTFAMGCVDGRDNVDGVANCEKDDVMATPAHEVTLTRPFQLGKYEVTFMEYDYYVWDQQRQGKAVAYPLDQGWGRYRRPVINVSWDDAVAYAAWLKGWTGKPYRLPSEAEWDYAARGGQDGTAYPLGKALGEKRANCGAGAHSTAPVGSFPATPFGLFDMHGNVQAWVQDGYGTYPAEPVRNPEGSPSEAGVGRVVRGGSWDDNGRNCRSAIRDRRGPDARYGDLGFRLALGH